MTDYFNWTDRAVRDLRTMWAAGRTFEEMACAFGVSRDALGSKARRLGLRAHQRDVVRRQEIPTNRRWTEAERDEIRRSHASATVEEIAERMHRTPGQVSWMLRRLGLDLCLEPPPVAAIECTTSNKAQDDRFRAAMLLAIAAGQEKVPMIGVDRRPGTKSPVFVRIHKQSLPPAASAIADCENG